jgi:hypothetical protein
MPLEQIRRHIAPTCLTPNRALSQVMAPSKWTIKRTRHAAAFRSIPVLAEKSLQSIGTVTFDLNQIS